MVQINGSTFVVTGGASGMGESVARSLLKQGANVAIFDRNEKRGKQLSEEFNSVTKGYFSSWTFSSSLVRSALFLKVDITSEGTMHS
jgi:NAD(P)-dependent dehydrogenase (short-subunit alcohol dehydrogenase family)